MRKITFLILCLFVYGAELRAQIFVDINAGLPPIINEASMAWSDYDNDGDKDLFVAGQNSAADTLLNIYRNDGNDVFTLADSLPALFLPTLVSGDYDNDGDEDLLLAGTQSYGSNPAVWIYENLGGGSFVKKNTGIAMWGSVDWADFDNDNDFDIVIAGKDASYSNVTRVYKNTGGAYSAVGAFLGLFYRDNSVKWGDYNNDGFPDVLVSGETSTTADYHIKVYRNNGGTSFTDMAFSFDQVSGCVNWDDYDHDGDLDISVTGNHNYNEPITKIYRNDGASFTDLSLSLTGLNGESRWVDLDNDGDDDLIMSGLTGLYPSLVVQIRMVRNDGAGVFSEQVIAVQPARTELRVADYDSDGDYDFAVSGEESFNGSVYSSRIYRNDLVMAVPETQGASASLYPNPFSSSALLDFETTGVPAENSSLTVYDEYGRMVKMIKDVQQGKVRIERENLNAGIYYYKLSGAGRELAAGKFIIN
jgi:hypothetical protein